MDQEKIGKFILELRKQKKLTQEQLARNLGITNRAISKWENGRGMPDLSLMKPLCQELGITINELLSGQKLDKKDYQEKYEENIINTINRADRKVNRIKNIFKISILLIMIILITLITLFIIDINRIGNNKPVLFSTWGYDYTPAIDLHEEKIEIAISNYLVNIIDNEPKHHENEKGFISFKIYLLEEKTQNKLYNIYAWVLEEKYYLENGNILQDSSSSIPYKFIVENINDEYVVSDSRIPRDGSLYAVDMKNIFPSSVRTDMNHVHTDGTIERLQLDIWQQIKLYYHLK